MQPEQQRRSAITSLTQRPPNGGWSSVEEALHFASWAGTTLSSLAGISAIATGTQSKLALSGSVVAIFSDSVQLAKAAYDKSQGVDNVTWKHLGATAANLAGQLTKAGIDYHLATLGESRPQSEVITNYVFIGLNQLSNYAMTITKPSEERNVGKQQLASNSAPAPTYTMPVYSATVPPQASPPASSYHSSNISPNTSVAAHGQHGQPAASSNPYQNPNASTSSVQPTPGQQPGRR